MVSRIRLPWIIASLVYIGLVPLIGDVQFEPFDGRTLIALLSHALGILVICYTLLGSLYDMLHRKSTNQAYLHIRK